jgi:hypothetical protein
MTPPNGEKGFPMREDTDIHDEDGYQQAERPTDDADRIATPDADQRESVDGEPYDPAHRSVDDRSTGDEAETVVPSAAGSEGEIRSDDEPRAASAAMSDEPAAASTTDERAGTDEQAATADGVESAELMPGEAPAEPPVTAVGWAEGAAEDMRVRWQELQLRFVDDPSGVAGEARALVAEAVRAVTDALAEQQRQLDSWSTAEGGDTEQLRVVVQQYRDFFDRMLDRAV